MATLTTPHYALPYPDGAERVMDGDNAIAALAKSVDAKLHELTAVVGYVNVDMQSQWAIAIGFGATFVTPPAVFAIGVGFAADNINVMTRQGQTTTTGATLEGTAAGAVGIRSIQWLAIGHRAQAGTRRERDEAETRPVDEGEAEAKG